ncbi:uncharacterized protein [Ambystoma mexicanum]|uniref:uncharacterized protein n=1 Tax=Ambystoma mexicanum TaxID=8296 RepID=UPI0037E93D27
MQEGQLSQVQLRRSHLQRFYSSPLPALEPSAGAAKRLSSSSSPSRLRPSTRKERPLSTPLPTRGLGLSVQAVRPLSCTSPPCTLEASSALSRPFSSSSPVPEQCTSTRSRGQEPSTRAARRLSGSSPPHGSGPSPGAAKRLSDSSPTRKAMPKVGSPRKMSSSSPIGGKIPSMETARQIPSSLSVREAGANVRTAQNHLFSESMCRLKSDTSEGIQVSSLPQRGSRHSVGAIRRLPSSLSISSSSSPNSLGLGVGSSGHINSLSHVNGLDHIKEGDRKLSSLSPACKLRPVKGRTKQVSFSLPLAGFECCAGAASQPIYSSPPVKLKPKMGIPVKISSSGKHAVPTRQLPLSSAPHQPVPSMMDARQGSVSPPQASMMSPNEAGQSTPTSPPQGLGPRSDQASHIPSSSEEFAMESRLEEVQSLSPSIVRQVAGPSLGVVGHSFPSATRHSFGLSQAGPRALSCSPQNHLGPGIKEPGRLPESSSHHRMGPGQGVVRKRLSSSAQHAVGQNSGTDRHAFSSSIPCRLWPSPGVTWRFCGSSLPQRLEANVGTRHKVSACSPGHELWPAAREICYSPPFQLEPSAVAARRLSSFSTQCGGK